MKVKVYYTTMREVEIEVDDKYEKLTDIRNCWAGELTEEEWEEVAQLHDDLEFEICTTGVDDDGFMRFNCVETLNGELLHEW